MKINNFKTFFLALLSLNVSYAFSQANEIDNDFIASLPDAVQEDILLEMQNSSDKKDSNLQRRPSSEISKLDTYKKWENFSSRKK